MKQRGNILFLILLAVVLFAALSYAVTSSMRGGGKDSGDETDALQATELINYAQSISTAITRMRLVNGCTDEQISFETDSMGIAIPSYINIYDNPNAPVSKKCHVFDVNGGGVGWRNLEKELDTVEAWRYYGHIFTGANPVYQIGCSDGNATCSDLVMIVDVTEDVCRIINEKLSIVTDGILPADGGSFVNIAFIGTYAYNGNWLGDNLGNKVLYGRPTGCFSTPIADKPKFYHVLIER